MKEIRQCMPFLAIILGALNVRQSGRTSDCRRDPGDDYQFQRGHGFEGHANKHLRNAAMRTTLVVVAALAMMTFVPSSALAQGGGWLDFRNHPGSGWSRRSER